MSRTAARLRRAPTRSCVACRTVRPKRELIRVVRRPDRTVAIDPTGRVAGRGAYVCDDAPCKTKSIERGALARALAAPIPADLWENQAGGYESRTLEGGDGDGTE